MSPKRLASFLLALNLFFGCATTSAPVKWLPDANDAGRYPYGGWIELSTSPDKELNVIGELLAISDGRVYVLAASEKVSVVSSDMVTYAKLTPIDMQARKIGNWVLIELVINFPIVPWLTGYEGISGHGFLYILSAPVWILAGILSASVESRGIQIDMLEDQWEDFAGYARFPQGMPGNFKGQSYR